ncbi:MAG: hypothetical protein II453_12780 [Alphaproteobacteria bacterium]|nr:hypothetical protein [Alphaproteobacteria bacterium]
MGKKNFYEEKDVPLFQEEVCKMKCVNKGKCIEEGQDSHWFLMCPHYHSWKLGYNSFVWENIIWEKEHPEEAKQRHKELVARAKIWGAEKRRLKNKSQ